MVRQENSGEQQNVLGFYFKFPIISGWSSVAWYRMSPQEACYLPRKPGTTRLCPGKNKVSKKRIETGTGAVDQWTEKKQ